MRLNPIRTPRDLDVLPTGCVIAQLEELPGFRLRIIRVALKREDGFWVETGTRRGKRAADFNFDLGVAFTLIYNPSDVRVRPFDV